MTCVAGLVVSISTIGTVVYANCNRNNKIYSGVTFIELVL